MRREVLRSLRVLACAGPLLAGTAPALAAQEPEPYEAKSPEVARRRSILGTVVPIAAGFAIDDAALGFFVGPLLGPVLGLRVRGGGTARDGAGGHPSRSPSGHSRRCGRDLRSALPLAAAVVVAGGVYTIVLAVRDINQVDDRVPSPEPGARRGLRAADILPGIPDGRPARLRGGTRHLGGVNDGRDHDEDDRPPPSFGGGRLLFRSFALNLPEAYHRPRCLQSLLPKQEEANYA